MKGRNESLYFAFALAIFLFAIVLSLNLIEPTAIPVSEDQYSKIRDTHLIDALVICPTGTYWQLKQSVRIEREGGEELAKRIVLVDDLQSVAIKTWRDRGGVEIEGQETSPYWAPVFISILLGIGLWHGWSQIQQDFKGEGSPRRRLQELDNDLKAGRITEDEFKDRAERIWPEL